MKHPFLECVPTLIDKPRPIHYHFSGSICSALNIQYTTSKDARLWFVVEITEKPPPMSALNVPDKPYPPLNTHPLRPVARLSFVSFYFHPVCFLFSQRAGRFTIVGNHCSPPCFFCVRVLFLDPVLVMSLLASETLLFIPCQFISTSISTFLPCFYTFSPFSTQISLSAFSVFFFSMFSTNGFM